MNLPSNFKDILSIPTGSRNASSSSLTDSQSQLWPENSQGASQDFCFSSRNVQQGSQEVCDQTVLSTYLAKPLLFGDLKDKTRSAWVLDKFEVDKKKAKEKTEGELLMKECQTIRETLSNIQQLVGAEQNAAVCQTVLEKFDNFASTLQNNLNRLQSEISQQFDTVVNKVTLQREMMYEIFQKNLEGLKEEQERERGMLETALEHLSTLVTVKSFKPGTEQAMDSAIQTSPSLLQSMLSIMQEHKHKGTQVTYVSESLEQKVEVFSQPNSRITAGETTRRVKKSQKKWPVVFSQRSKCAVLDESSQPFVNGSAHHWKRGANQGSFTRDSLIPLNRETRPRKAAERYTTPQCLQQENNIPVGLQDVTPVIEKLTTECNIGALVAPGGFWQLFDSDVDP